MYQKYLKMLGEIPLFLLPYLNVPSLVRLKKVGYFCGMDYASKNIYNFREYISRYDHSLSVCLLTYKLTKDKIMSISALFHDIATPCFSHVIDYMNKDYEKQESTEELTKEILLNDKYLNTLLIKDQIDINDILDYKKYPIVDNTRPKLCVDRLDGIILNGISWTKNITINDIKNIINDLNIFINEDNEKEIGFKSKDITNKLVDINTTINNYCHSKEDNYMMELLANITKKAIDNNYLSYEDLYSYNEEEIFNKLDKVNNKDINKLLIEFRTIKKEDIPDIRIPNLKNRIINPLVNNKRFL